MTTPELDPLVEQVRLRDARQRRWQRDGDGSVARRLAQIGVLGWMIVVPILTGMFAGRWLDGRFQTGLLWTAALLMLGAVVGSWSAWRWMQRA